MMILRLPFAGLLGGFVAAALFYLLWGLVGSPIELRRAVQIVRLPTMRIDRPVLIEDFVRPIKVEREDPPRVPGRPGLEIDGPGKHTATVPGNPGFPRNGIAIGPVGPGIGGNGTDGDAAPLVRVAPQYPPQAIARNLEGWVRVRFDVAADGTVKGPRVVAAEPQSIFDGAALAAVARWRYRPRVDGGVAVERVGLETILRFELEE
jgi:protein TonB